MNKSGIHIKEGNEGKFTAQAKRAGMGVQEFAKHVLANKDKYSTATVKRAVFASNAAKWNKEGDKIIIKQTGGQIMPFTKTWEQIKETIKTGVNDAANAYVGNKFTNDSTYYRQNVQPIIFPKAKGYVPPKPGVSYGEALTDGGVKDYDKAVNVIESLSAQPKRPEYKQYWK